MAETEFDHLQPMTMRDWVWFLAHNREPFRFRPATTEESREAGVQTPDAIAIVATACRERGGFLIVAAGERPASASALIRLAEALGVRLDIAERLAHLLPNVRPETLAFAAAHLIARAPFCEGCHCAVRWGAILGGVATENAPAACDGMRKLDATFAAFKARTSDVPVRRISDEPVVTAAAAIRDIGRLGV